MRPTETYNDQVVRLFLLAAAVWGIVGMSIGVYAAAEMAWPSLNFGVPWLSFGRVRSDHTFGVIFAFGGSALMGTCYYVVQRTGHTRLAFTALANFTFWGWQLGCVLAMATMLFGITQSKEYAEPEWFIDIAVAVVWISFGTVFFGMLACRRIRHIYVANWYYGAFIIAVGLLHIVNNLGDTGVADQVVPDLFRLGRRDGAMVVRPQRGGVPPDRGLPRHDVLLRAAPGTAAAVEAHRFSIVNFWALISVAPCWRDRTTSYVHRAARLGAVGGHGKNGDPARCRAGDRRPTGC